MGGAGAADERDPLAWQGGSQPGPGGGAQELAADGSPAGGVVDEQARAAGGSAGQHHPVAVEVELVAGHPRGPVQQLVAAQPRVADQLVEVLHQVGLVQHGQTRELDGFVADRTGVGEAPTVERGVGGGVPDHGVQALLLVLSELRGGPVLAAGLGSCQPQGCGHVG